MAGLSAARLAEIEHAVGDAIPDGWWQDEIAMPLLAEVRRLRAVVQWYANPRSWCAMGRAGGIECNATGQDEWASDYGYRARAALA